MLAPPSSKQRRPSSTLAPDDRVLLSSPTRPCDPAPRDAVCATPTPAASPAPRVTLCASGSAPSGKGVGVVSGHIPRRGVVVATANLTPKSSTSVRGGARILA